MKYSIKFKLFAALFSLILFFVIMSWGLNNFLLEKYYFYDKQKVLLDSYNSIASLYGADSEVLVLELERIENFKGLNIVILDKELNTIYDSRRKGIEPGLGRRDFRDPMGFRIKEVIESIAMKRPFIAKRWDDRLNTNFISLYSLLKDEVYVYMNTPVAAMQESVEIANNFFLFTGIITLMIGGISVLLMASRFTKPILDLNGIAQRMSSLDFSKRYPVKSHDEIGHLGESINSLSEQLEKSIFELRQANEKLTEDIKRERKIDEMRKEFITSVSHELKTPIALIQGYSEGLKINVNDDEENKNYYCDVIMDEATKMNKLVRQLLDLSQIEAGEIPLEKSGFELSEFVEYLLRKNSIVFNEKNIDVVFEKGGNIFVKADYERIEQVLTNYLNNAVNHVDDKKSIKIGIRRLDDYDKARVTVFNSGRHIPEQSMAKIWSSFYKVDKARTRAYGGTGVGLSIVRAIMEAHGNKYGAGNSDGGVEFWFEIDLAE